MVNAAGRPERRDPRTYLESLGRDELIELILDAAEREEVLHTELAVASTTPESVHDLRRVIEDSVIPGGYVPYREATATPAASTWYSRGWTGCSPPDNPTSSSISPSTR